MKEPFDVECALTEYRGTARGVEVELVMRVYDRREMCVWESTCILLSQNAETLKKARDLTPCSDIEEEGQYVHCLLFMEWELLIRSPQTCRKYFISYTLC